jgi:hypothetical protein
VTLAPPARPAWGFGRCLRVYVAAERTWYNPNKEAALAAFFRHFSVSSCSFSERRRFAGTPDLKPQVWREIARPSGRCRGTAGRVPRGTCPAAWSRAGHRSPSGPRRFLPMVWMASAIVPRPISSGHCPGPADGYRLAKRGARRRRLPSTDGRADRVSGPQRPGHSPGRSLRSVSAAGTAPARPIAASAAEADGERTPLVFHLELHSSHPLLSVPATVARLGRRLAFVRATERQAVVGLLALPHTVHRLQPVLAQFIEVIVVVVTAWPAGMEVTGEPP